MPFPGTWRKRGGTKSLFFSGEGFLITLTGPGTLFAQTGSEQAFIDWIVPCLPRSGN